MRVGRAVRDGTWKGEGVFGRKFGVRPPDITRVCAGLPGCLTEAELRASRGGVPERWGIFPRVVLALMGELGSEAGASIHASAIEVYQNDAYDLLADRVPLRVGGSKKCVSPCFGIVGWDRPCCDCCVVWLCLGASST